MSKKVKRARVPKPFFEEEWRTLPTEEAVRVMKACSSPIRSAILWVLDRQGPTRQFELTKAVAKVLARSLGDRYKRYDDASLRHHLRELEQAGLIGFERAGPRQKVIYRTEALRLQLRPIERAPPAERVPETLEEVAEVLRRIFRR